MYVCCQLSRKDGIILLIRRDILILFDLLRIANTWAQIDSTIGISITHTVNRGFYITQVRGFNVYLISHLLFFGHARRAPSKCVYEDNRAVPRNSENEREFACWFEKLLYAFSDEILYSCESFCLLIVWDFWIFQDFLLTDFTK